MTIVPVSSSFNRVSDTRTHSQKRPLEGAVDALAQESYNRYPRSSSRPTGEIFGESREGNRFAKRRRVSLSQREEPHSRCAYFSGQRRENHRGYIWDEEIRTRIMNGDIEGAYRGLDEIRKGGAKPNIAAYAIVINEYRRQRDFCPNFFDLFWKMRCDGITLDLKLRNILVDACTKSTNFNFLLESWPWLLEDGYEPDRFIYHALIQKCLLKEELYERALTFVREMVAYAVDSDVKLSNIRIKALAINGCFKRGFDPV